MANEDKVTNVKEDTGTTNLLIGSGIGAYGLTNFAISGFVCPACLVLTPAFLGFGAYKKYKFLKNKDSSSEESS